MFKFSNDWHVLDIPPGNEDWKFHSCKSIAVVLHCKLFSSLKNFIILFIRGIYDYNKIVIRIICPISHIGDGRSSSKMSSINVLDYFELRNQLYSLIPENDLAAIFCVKYSLFFSSRTARNLALIIVDSWLRDQLWLHLFLALNLVSANISMHLWFLHFMLYRLSSNDILASINTILWFVGIWSASQESMAMWILINYK